jgi:hypothetical protein
MRRRRRSGRLGGRDWGAPLNEKWIPNELKSSIKQWVLPSSGAQQPATFVMNR